MDKARSAEGLVAVCGYISKKRERGRGDEEITRKLGALQAMVGHRFVRRWHALMR